MVLVSGDSHADYQYLRRLYDRAIDNDIKDIVICGDFGYWPKDPEGKNFLYCLNKLLTNKDIKVYFVDGNHEDYIELMKLPQDRVSELPEVHNCFYIPRGKTIEIDGRKFMGFGGAVSVDRKWRVLNKSWFVEEEITIEQIKSMQDISDIDYLITHDAPLNLLTMDYKNDPISDLHRQQIQNIISIVKPMYLIHGHYHQKWDYSYQGTVCYGLGHNYDDISLSTMII